MLFQVGKRWHVHGCLCRWALFVAIAVARPVLEPAHNTVPHQLDTAAGLVRAS